MSSTTNNNGTNGNGTLARRTHHVEQEPPELGEVMQPPPWLKNLRDAMSGAICGDDLKEIMQAQVDKAKGGDMKAASFVFNQAHKLMQSEQKRVTIVQNNYYDTPADARPDAPIQPGDDQSGRDLAKLGARARAGLPVTGNPKDRRVRPVSDEEEKELRRQQQAAEEGD